MRQEKELWKLELIGMLQVIKDLDGACVVFGDRAYSVREIISEIEADTRIGRELVRLYRARMERTSADQ